MGHQEGRSLLRRARKASLGVVAAVLAGTVGLGLAASGASAEVLYCNDGAPSGGHCPVVGVYNFTTANVNHVYYTGTPGISVCERVTNASADTTLSRRCNTREIWSYDDVVAAVMCSGYSPFGIRYIAGNDSSVTHTIQGWVYETSDQCV